MNIMGATKLDEAIDGVRQMITDQLDERPDLRVEDVVIVVNTSSEREGDTRSDGIFYSCSDYRPWFQAALLQRAIDAVYDE